MKAGGICFSISSSFVLSAFLLCSGLPSVQAGALGVHMYSFDGAGQTGSGPSGGGEQWVQDEKGWWYSEAGGKSWPASQWKEINGEWYYFGDDGYMHTGWLTDGGERYYLDSSTGAMLRNGETVIDGMRYSFDEHGVSKLVWAWKSPVVIPPEEEKGDLEKALDSMCDSVLSGIIREGMTDRQKLSAICSWIVSSFRYAGASATRDWVREAYEGLRRRHGDCYTYFAVSQALLTRAGFPSIEVIRYTDNGHYWNLTMVDGNWYHFDTTPRSWRRSFFLLTDREMAALSAAHGGCFEFDRSLYPPTP